MYSLCGQCVIIVALVLCQQNSPGKSTNDCEHTEEEASNNRLGISLTLPFHSCSVLSYMCAHVLYIALHIRLLLSLQVS